MDSYPQQHGNAPFFSICLTTYDREELLRQTLNSLLNQTFEDFEVVIGNDNLDRPLSAEILGVNDARVRIINYPQRQGTLGNMSRLLELGRGRYITSLADDDLLAPQFLAAIHAALIKYDFPSCVFTSYELHYGSSQPDLSKQYSGQATLYSGADFLRMYLMEQVKAIGSMGMFDTEYLRRTGGIEDVSNDGVWVYLEYMLLVRVGLLEKVAYIPAPLICYRIHEGSWGVANTDLDAYFRAGEALVLKSAEVLSEGYAGNRAETLLLVFNLALKQLLNKTGLHDLSLDVRAMLEKANQAITANFGSNVDKPLEIIPSGIELDVVSLLLQQFADAETGRICKELELDAAKKKDEEIRSLKADCDVKDQEIEDKDNEIRLLKAGCNTKDDEIRLLKKICEEREMVIFELDRRVKFLERTNIPGKLLVMAHSVLMMGWVTFKKFVMPLITPRLGVLQQHAPRTLSSAALKVNAGLPRQTPKISIVTPSYNQAVYLERTLRSVLEQGYPNLEYVVQDGGSKDGSAEVLKRYSAQLAFWESKQDGGQTNAINLGFRHTDGEIMAYLNSDDLLLPGALAYVAEYFNTHPEVDAVYGHRVIIDENDLEIGRWVLPSHDNEVLSWADFIPQETLFWRRRAWEKIGGSLDESFHFAMDWDLLLRLRNSGAKFVRLPHFLAAFRVHSQQKTSAEIGDVGFREMNRLRERELGRVPSGAEVSKAVAPYLLRHVAADFFYRVRQKLGW